jgi:hypothetical protein
MSDLDFDRMALQRLPLAEAALLLFRHVSAPLLAGDLFDRFRGRCYQDTLPFAVVLAILQDALLNHRGSARPACSQARDQHLLTTHHGAFYEKLAHTPLPLSEAFVREGSQRLQQALPQQRPPSPVPASVQHFRVEIFDGKVTKRVAKRLGVLRGLAGAALGGKGLVCLNRHTGLVSALAGCADGHVNDAALLPGLVEQMHALAPGQTLLWVGDAQFADLTQPPLLQGRAAGRDDHFVLRYNNKTSFLDEGTPPELARAGGLATGTDDQGRPFEQAWGRLGKGTTKEPRRVRRICLQLASGKRIAIITDLFDPERYPAADLLRLYQQRGGIEGVFQQITEVFSLERLIGSKPKGTVLQLAFCLQLYNVVTVLSHHVAAGQTSVGAEGLPVPMSMPEVSKEMLYRDVQKQLSALLEVTAEGVDLGRLLGGDGSRDWLRVRLTELLQGLWDKLWRKTGNRKPRPHPDKPRGKGHVSVQRALDQEKERARSPA